MDKYTDDILKFEQALNNKRIYTHKVLYHNTRISSNDYKMEDVISTVSKQIKAIQKADSVKQTSKFKKPRLTEQPRFLPTECTNVSKQDIQGRYNMLGDNDRRFDTNCNVVPTVENILNKEFEQDTILQKPVSKVEFQKANGTSSISDQALFKSKCLFQDIQNDYEDNKVIGSLKSECTLKNNKIEPSELLNPIKFESKLPLKAHNDKDNIEDKNSNNIDQESIKINDDIILQEFENSLLPELSDESLLKYKATLNDIEHDIGKSRALLNDIDHDVGKNVENNLKIHELLNIKRPHDIDQAEDDALCFKGFTTASHKKIKISEKALLQCKTIFQDIDMDTIDDAMYKKCHTDNNNIKVLSGSNSMSDSVEDTFKPKSDISVLNKKCEGFVTAAVNNVVNNAVNNAVINVSSKPLTKYKNIFPCIKEENLDEVNEVKEENIESHKTNVKSNQNINLSKNLKICFQTASQKPVGISEESLACSQRLLNNIDQSKRFNKNVSDTSLKSFQTSRNKGTKNISNKPFVRGKRMSTAIELDIEKDNIDNDNEEQVKPTLWQFNNEDTSMQTFKGFQTASNKKLQVSKQALAKTLNIFDGIDLRLDGNTVDNISQHNLVVDQDNVKNIRSGFKLTNKWNKEIDDMNDDNIESYKTNVESNQNINLSKNFKFCFQTASQKPVGISEESLACSQRLLNNIDQSKGFNKNLCDTSKIKNISNKAFAAGNSILAGIELDIEKKNIDNENEKQVKPTTNWQFDNKDMSMQTASNKKLKVSNSNTVIRSDSKLTSKWNDKILRNNESSSCNIQHKKETTNNFHTRKANSSYTVDTTNIDIKDMIDTQIIDNFQDELNTEDFFKTRTTLQNRETSKSPVLEVRKNNYKILSDDSQERIKQIKNIKDHDTILQKPLIKNQNTILQKPPCHTIDKTNDIDITDDLSIQFLNNFEVELNTEDFSNKRSRFVSKRSGSPIISFPKVKKPKFQAPAYVKKNIMIPRIELCQKKIDNVFEFDTNYKKRKIYTLKDLGNASIDNTIVDNYVMNFNYENILDFKFKEERNEVTNDIWCTVNIKENFLESVNRKLVPSGWIENHLKLIIWKLISYEIKFPHCLKTVCTVKNVMEQLKYRYDRELYYVQRPALRKILERDDVASKSMVLCVVGIYVDGNYVTRVANITDTIELLLTDGWYCIKARIDRFLGNQVYYGKICVGTKLIMQGAQLINCEHGIAPWEDTSAVHLKVFGNSTRRARWDARLGYHGNPAILSRLSNIKPEGGKVSKVRVFVTRVYPALYIEKLEDGSTVTRSERLEHLHQTKYESDRQTILEKIYEDIEREFSEEQSQDSEGLNKKELGSQVAKLMKMHADPGEFKAYLTESQLDLLQDYTKTRREKQIEQIERRVQERIKSSGLDVDRSVVPLWKIRVAGNEDKLVKGMLSIWRPSEAIQEIVAENTWIDVYNVVPTAIRNSEIHLSASRQSIFQRSKCTEAEKINSFTDSLKRRCYHIKDIVRNPKMSTDYNEIDTAGLVISIEPDNINFESSMQLYQNVYLVDENKNVICVNFWGGIKKFGFGNILDVGQVVVCVNLHKRSGNTMRNIPQYRATEFTYFTKPPKHESLRKLSEELLKTFSGLDIRKFCADCVKNNLLNVKHLSPDISPYRMNHSDYNITKNKIFIDSPVAGGADFNLSGLDFESSFKQTDTHNLSADKLLRKKRVNEKIAKLKCYGEPPALNPINIINKSKNIRNAFRSPLTSRNECTIVVSHNTSTPIGTVTKASDNSNLESSPVLPVNIKYGKQTSVHPVRLDFNNIVSESEDNAVNPFDKELNTSPAMSLD